MAYEASEIMLAAAMMYTNKQLQDYSKDAGTLREMMIDARGKIKTHTDKHIHFGSPSIEKGFTDLMDEKNSEALKDLAGGISAAYGVREYLQKTGESSTAATSPNIYMTGNV